MSNEMIIERWGGESEESFRLRRYSNAVAWLVRWSLLDWAGELGGFNALIAVRTRAGIAANWTAAEVAERLASEIRNLHGRNRMLVLTRKETETIHLVEAGVTITIVEVGRNKVRIGIEAPRELTILRGEHLERSVDPLARVDVEPNRGGAVASSPGS